MIRTVGVASSRRDTAVGLYRQTNGPKVILASGEVAIWQLDARTGFSTIYSVDVTSVTTHGAL